MSCVAVIPARGGSKRIPRKNIKDFLGKPIIAYTIEAALTSGLFDEVMVSTDDEEIAAVMPLVRFSYPPQRSYRVDDEGRASFIDLRYIESRSQDLEPMYHEIGQYYFYNVEKYRRADGIIKNDVMAIIVGENEAQDIDTEEDWKTAELKYIIIKGLMELE